MDVTSDYDWWSNYTTLSGFYEATVKSALQENHPYCIYLLHLLERHIGAGL
jgi:hypothetical protein